MENIINPEISQEKSSFSDCVKILEISNYIDDWEKEVLFSPSGFYSLKGKDVLGKTENIISQLELNVEKIISDLVFESADAERRAGDIKKKKIRTIMSKMSEYENSEKIKWEQEVIDSAVENSKTKATEYKHNAEIVEKCYLNGITSIGLKAELLNLNKKQLDFIISQFNSDFFEALVWSFIDDNSLDALKCYSENKHYIWEEKQKTIESALKNLENKTTAFEKAKELFSQNFSLRQGEEQISKIKNDEVKKYVKLYFEGFIHSKENSLTKQKNELNEKIWRNIDKMLGENSDFALFEVDLNQDEKSIISQQNYIKTMIEKGKIQTDDSKFFELYLQAFEKSEKFENVNLYDFRHCLSQNDFEFFKELQENLRKDDFLNLKIIYFELKKYFIEDDDLKNAEFIKTFNYEKKLWEKNNKKQAELVQIRELLNSLQIKKASKDSDLKKEENSKKTKSV